MIVLRSLLFAAIFYPLTMVFCIAGIVARVAGRPATLAVVRRWMDLHRWLTIHLLHIQTRVEGTIPDGPHLVAVKHQSMFETVEVARLTGLPIVVYKKELSRIPLFGGVTRAYGVIAVERSAGAKALRALVAEGRKALADNRSVIIYPEGTRVPVGQTPPLQSGFAGLYRALGLPVLPVAIDSGRLWARGIVKHSGTINIVIGEVIPPGLGRDAIETRVHTAINAIELGAQPRS
ncbi:MAG: lysophospholipid acyltransferase family protein [Sphingomicrobium sp.]